MALSDHIRLTLLVDGVKQTRVSNIQVNGQSGAQAVEALEGLLGKTPGARRLEITGNWAVPTSGLEFDVVTAVANGTYHELQVPVGSKSIISQGWFDTFGLSQSTNANTEVTATFHGELNPPQ